MSDKESNYKIKSVAIVSYFKHHSTFSGYKNVLRFTKPIKIFGIDYTKKNNKILLSHYFIHEFITRIKTIGCKFNILHILYGEDYFRFSHWLFPKKKLVVTFHQPGEILLQELSRGNYNGRIAGFTHRLTRNRLSKISAAIVMTEEQKKIASKFIDKNKIHVIPLGVELTHLNKLFYESTINRNKNQLITVGEWQRDWELFFDIVSYSLIHFPKITFIVVNKNANNQLIEKYTSYKNVKFIYDIPSSELHSYYLGSIAMFLPLVSAAGNNAVNEGLALGCPIISNYKLDAYKNNENFSFCFHSFEEFKTQLQKLQQLNPDSYSKVSKNCNNSVQEYSWESVSNKLIEIYNSI